MDLLLSLTKMISLALLFLDTLLAVVWPFVFIFFLIEAVRRAITGERYRLVALTAGFALLVMLGPALSRAVSGTAGMTGHSGLLGYLALFLRLLDLLFPLSVLWPFLFVFCLVEAIKRAVKEEPYTLIAMAAGFAVMVMLSPLI